MTTEPGRTIYKVRVPALSRQGLQVAQLFLILAALFGLIGLLAFGQYALCHQDDPNASFKECFSAVERAKIRKGR